MYAGPRPPGLRSVAVIPGTRLGGRGPFGTGAGSEVNNNVCRHHGATETRRVRRLRTDGEKFGDTMTPFTRYFAL